MLATAVTVEEKYQELGLIDGSDDPFDAKYPVWERHIRIPEAWLDILYKKATLLEFWVFVGLTRFMDWETLKAHPSISELSGVVHKDIKEIHRTLNGLESKRIIAIGKLKEKGKYGRPPNEYTILLNPLKKHYKYF